MKSNVWEKTFVNMVFKSNFSNVFKLLNKIFSFYNNKILFTWHLAEGLFVNW